MHRRGVFLGVSTWLAVQGCSARASDGAEVTIEGVLTFDRREQLPPQSRLGVLIADVYSQHGHSYGGEVAEIANTFHPWSFSISIRVDHLLLPMDIGVSAEIYAGGERLFIAGDIVPLTVPKTGPVRIQLKRQ